MGSSGLPAELKTLWASNGLPEHFLSHVKLLGEADSAVDSSFRLGLAAQIAIGLAGLSAAYLHYLRTGVEQDVSVDARHAVLSFHSEAWYTSNGSPPPAGLWDSIAGLYKTKNAGWVRIHTNFPHHRKGVLDILGIPDSVENPAEKAQVAEAILAWDALDFEETCAEKGMCVSALRTHDEWKGHAQAKALQDVLPVEVCKVAEGLPKLHEQKIIGQAKRPLEGVNVLDLSRVLAGPIAGRTLAAHGADMLLITSPNLPSLPLIDVETSLGKRTTQLDLLSQPDREKLRNLAQNADVFLQAYRPDAIDAKGFGVDGLVGIAEAQPDGKAFGGVVCANLRAWGWDGPWKDRRGFDSLVQTATGFNFDEALAYQFSTGSKEAETTPRPLPMQALDHAAGYFLAFGVNVALSKMITEGGSYEVRVSLAAVGQWIRSLGRLSSQAAFGESKPYPKRCDDEIARLSVVWSERHGSRFGSGGQMSALRHGAVLSETPVREGILPIEHSYIDVGDDWGAPMKLDADDSETVSAQWRRRRAEGLSI